MSYTRPMVRRSEQSGSISPETNAQRRLASLVPYGGAVLAVWVGLSLCALSPVLHRDAFAVFLGVVVVVARFFGFGPALLASLLSTACLRFAIFHHFTLRGGSAQDLERLV